LVLCFFESHIQKRKSKRKRKEDRIMEGKGFVLAAWVTVSLILFVTAPYVEAGGWQPWTGWRVAGFGSSLEQP
jgi:hypothetical protein